MATESASKALSAPVALNPAVHSRIHVCRRSFPLGLIPFEAMQYGSASRLAEMRSAASLAVLAVCKSTSHRVCQCRCPSSF
jgi:hypothetical protein